MHMTKRRSTDDCERRKQSRLHKLGTDNPCCAVCGNSDWRVIEEHHVAGRKHHSQVVLLCANHHRILTDDQKDHLQTSPGADELLAQIGNFLLGLANMLAVIVDRLHEFGATLIACANEAYPNSGEAT
jgi:hypothetical protein